MPGFYDDPAVYDVLSTPGTAAEVDGLERIARRFAPAPDPARHRWRWLEPASGTGRYLRVLARRGHRAVGFDRSPAMVGYARERLRRLGLGRRTRVFAADMTSFAALLGRERFDIAFNLVNTIRHLESDAAMRAHFREVARALRPGGIYVVGIHLSRYGEHLPEEDVWSARRGRVLVRQLVQYLPPERGGRTELVVSHLAIERPSGTEHRDAKYGLQCYDAGQWSRLLATTPFRHEATVTRRGEPIAVRGVPYALDVLRRPDADATASLQSRRTLG